MRGIYLFNYIFILIALSILSTSCGNQSKSSGNDFNTTPRSQVTFNGNLDDDIDDGPMYSTTSTTQRECFNPIDNLNESALAAFFGGNISIQNREGPATACIFSNGAGSSFSYNLRIEYEDDAGLRTYSSNKQSSQTEYLHSNTDTNNTELILMDNVGFIQLVGSNNGDGTIDIELKFANLPSYYQKDSNGDYVLNLNSGRIPASNSADFNTQRDCLNSSSGNATLNSGANCAASYRFPRSFWKSAWWGEAFSTTQMNNLLTMIRQYTNNSFPVEFSSSNINVENGSIGVFTINSLE